MAVELMLREQEVIISPQAKAVETALASAITSIKLENPTGIMRIPYSREFHAVTHPREWTRRGREYKRSLGPLLPLRGGMDVRFSASDIRKLLELFSDQTHKSTHVFSLEHPFQSNRF